MRCPKGMNEADTMLKVICKKPQPGYFDQDFGTAFSLSLGDPGLYEHQQ